MIIPIDSLANDGVMPVTNQTLPSIVGSAVTAPSHLVSDYIEIVGFTLLIFFGSITNGLALFSSVAGKSAAEAFGISRYAHMSARQRQLAKPKKRRLNPTQNALRHHLLASNVVVLAIYCPTMVVWLVWYEWPFGAAACPVLNFVFLFAFCFASNVVACIAADRALYVRKLVALESTGSTAGRKSFLRKAARRLPLLAWSLAVVAAAPQLVAFVQIDIVVDSGRHFVQCVNIWQAAAFRPSGGNLTGLLADNWQVVYEVYHEVVMFSLPLLVIVLSYCSVVVRLLMYSCRPYTSVSTTSADHSNRVGNFTRGETATAPAVAKGSVIAAATPPNSVACDETTSLRSQAHTSRGGATGPPSRPDPVDCRRIPAWRLQMRSRMFRTAGLVVACYCLTWCPYVCISTLGLLHDGWRKHFSESVNWANCLIVLNAVLNPLVYRVWK